MKIVISEASGKSYQVELTKDREAFIIGKKIGEKIEADMLGVPGYILELTGGSDSSGFAMRKDVAGQRKLRVLLSGGSGFNAKRKGELRKKLIRGNTFSADIAQVNTKVITGGASSLEQLLPKKEEKK